MLSSVTRMDQNFVTLKGKIKIIPNFIKCIIYNLIYNLSVIS